ncbi:flagellar basal-body rod protein FlgF [Fulvimonas yonginensis]|uniref:Flagellar basal-body rod protein FlgF n=1 Tax=Fulvimonas yonginensis TaxID=1495200 RepID=A0ABU8JDR2_9GAMM
MSLQSLYNSLSGLFAFSKGLDTISNNISNMNTPGFRGKDSFFENVMGEFGTRIEGTGIRTSEGQIEQTGNNTDLAINGEGLFVLRDPSTGKYFYTRAGQFQFDAQGYLVDTVSQYHVQGIDESGNLADISITTLRTLPAQATTMVGVTGNLSPQDTDFTINSLTVYDADGNTHTYSIKLTNNGSTTPGRWSVVLRDASGQAVANGEIRFSSDGSIKAGYNTMSVSLTLAGKTQAVTLDFGAAGSLSGATSYPGVGSNLVASPKDGHSVVGVASYSFDENGVLQLKYTDQETRQGARVALAAFPDESSLELLNGRLYDVGSGQQRQLGGAGEGVFGKIVGGSLEMSNVDLAQELADMIVIQRGYQANSRVMTVTNDMLQQLYDSTHG